MSASAVVPKFVMPSSEPRLARRTQPNKFFMTVGRRSALFGYEHGRSEVWAHPLKLVDDLGFSFRLQGYPLDISDRDALTHIELRPERVTLTYTHAAFTIRQHLFASVDAPGVVILFDVDSVLPITITGSFRPSLRLAWPAGSGTPSLTWDERERIYYVSEETARFACVVGAPGGEDVSVLPYQEEPRDVPAAFRIAVTPEQARANFIPVILTGSVEGRATAKRTYDDLLRGVRGEYERAQKHYEALDQRTTNIDTPDARLNRAFTWAKIGTDKGFATNPLFKATGLLAGFRTSGNSERPGFAWFFGRDALWTSLALTATGDFDGTRTALDFLARFQRQDGKIPHEISQSAALLPWFSDYAYPWASADATPLFCIAHAELWQTSGDTDYLRRNWEGIKRAYAFTLRTDTDANGLVENTDVGHGWVEGGALYPPHEEIYLQALWLRASGEVAELARVMDDTKLAREADANFERTRAAVEKTYWLANEGFYAFAINRPRAVAPTADPGPNRDVRQRRMNELKDKSLFDEDTVMPAVALLWRELEDARAQSQIDHLASGKIATDWGARIISNESRLYDPLSYHHGSVWALFTGWASLGAYAYNRPHAGYQFLMANALLTESDALGSITELLSGDFNRAFGRSSHHQIWSEAMVTLPVIRGLFGVEVRDGGSTLRFSPQLPADWNQASLSGVRVGSESYSFVVTRGEGSRAITIKRDEARPNEARLKAEATRTTQTKVRSLALAIALPLDAAVGEVTINKRTVKFQSVRRGDMQRIEIAVSNPEPIVEVELKLREGTEVSVVTEDLVAGERSKGLRIIRAHINDAGRLRLVLEGVGGIAYTLAVRSPAHLKVAEGVLVELNKKAASDAQLLRITFPDASKEKYVRRELEIELKPQRQQLDQSYR